MHPKMKSLNTQLRKKGLEMVQEDVDPELGPLYTIHSLKAGISNTDVAYRLYYAGEVQKWSASRRKAIARAEKRIKAAEAAAQRERSKSESSKESTPEAPT
ncbi:uncharacterized protein Z518_05440 [Rhinocladiella mackenziei CBS 650.93]|uniref:Uncharacterized protein n=1 Tax=Rhinocladiella mackenziei CBS 650.93 TaxID=1442369 RepID=A0A0D2J6A4_9EURO|nr:uncharacterized protein Z518_05440 [Rhinocladiella mackenziei CBS 650.93]KIX04570.1 hypothetical protein Z518_05440 [Rhinocladiella mackenziei CBS 650.93]